LAQVGQLGADLVDAFCFHGEGSFLVTHYFLMRGVSMAQGLGAR